MDAPARQILGTILSILRAGCAGSASGVGMILEVRMRTGMFLALFLSADGSHLRMRGAKVSLPGGF